MQPVREAARGGGGSSGLLKQQLSSAGQSAMVGLYSLRALSSTYFGPVINVRRVSDNSTSDFYANSTGTLGQSINGTGTTITTWLNSSTGYITQWYDQSGMGNNASQSKNGSQPTINISSGCINFSNNINSFLNLPDGTVPYGNSAYTVTLKHGSIGTLNGFLGSGNYGTYYQVNAFRTDGTNYINYWWGNDFTNYGTVAANNVVTYKYTKDVSRSLYVNGTFIASMVSSGRASTRNNNTIGLTDSAAVYRDEYLNSNLYYIAIFNVDLSDADRQIVETI